MCGDEFDIGDVVTLTVQWADKDGIALNPTAVTLIVRDPTGTNVTHASGFSNASLGNYEIDIGPVSLPGRWHYRWEAAGALVAAEEGSFRVARSRVIG